MHDVMSQLEPQINYICEVSGATGLSLSVLSGGKEAYSKHFGFRDVEAQRAPDGDTAYFIGSVTKGMLAALVGILVEEGKLDDGIWIQRAGNILLPKSEAIRTWIAQPVVRDFRSDFLYNNYAYEIVGQVVEKVENKSLEEVFKEKLWEPLGMHRTSMEDLSGNSNAAKAYYALDDASSYEVPMPTISHRTINGAGGAVRSCTNDMAKFYINFMRAANDQFNNTTTSTPGSPFKQLTTILRPHTQIDLVSMREQSYALGWARAQLPCPLGTLNYNHLLAPSMPIIGQGALGQLVLYHGGSIQGFAASLYLLPETETAIITMQNSSGLGDACDWAP
ncbi:hypothetical protein IL306_013812, partial [Fusarium sp. DS 682]